ncbi:MAG: MBL fold metallo-hydrolase [Thermoanaerobaculia bacterium]|nr:MBL fold metallo-hydrolase [Thermoanaerobaculia bacterium]
MTASASSLTENRLSEAVSVFTYGGETLATSYGANAVAFFGEGAIVLVDPFVSHVQAAELDALLRARTAAPVTHVVLTHHHTDHALGAGYFAAKGAEVVAHELAAARMAKEHPGLIAERRRIPEVAHLFEAARPYVPSRIVFGTFLLEAGGLRLDVFHPGHAHTPGDLCVYAASLGILVSGDLVSTNYHPNLEDADVAGWRAALEALRGIPFRTLVPGHGPAGGREAVEDQLRYLDRTRNIVSETPKSAGEDEVLSALARAFPEFRLRIVLPALVDRIRGT